MSNPVHPTPPDNTSPRQPVELTSGIVVVGLWVYLIVVLLLAVRTLAVIWPHSTWIDAWYGSETRSQAAAVAMEKTWTTLQESRQHLATLKGVVENPLTAAQLKSLNQGLGVAVELLAQCEGPTEPHEAIGANAVPTAIQLVRLNLLISAAEEALKCRRDTAQTRQRRPGWGDLFLARLPSEKCAGRPSVFFWQPLISESAGYAEALTKIRQDHPPAFAGSGELHFIVIVMLFGFIGGATQALVSLALYVGERMLYRSWTLHYLTLPWIGGSLAVAVYALFRGGFLNMEAQIADVVNIYAFSGLAVLVGLSTQQATELIKALAEHIFHKKTASDPVKPDPEKPAPPSAPPPAPPAAPPAN